MAVADFAADDVINMVQQAHGADFELGVLSIGMTLESNAIKYFSGAAESTGSCRTGTSS